MPLVLVEVPDEAAVEALRQQKNVHVVGVIIQPAPAVAPAPAAAPPPRQWAGALAGGDADAWDKHLREIRNEWERDI